MSARKFNNVVTHGASGEKSWLVPKETHGYSGFFQQKFGDSTLTCLGDRAQEAVPFRPLGSRGGMGRGLPSDLCKGSSQVTRGVSNKARKLFREGLKCFFLRG